MRKSVRWNCGVRARRQRGYRQTPRRRAEAGRARRDEEQQEPRAGEARNPLNCEQLGVLGVKFVTWDLVKLGSRRALPYRGIQSRSE